MTKKEVVCSFCGRTIDRNDIKEEKEKVFLGSSVDIAICDKCVNQCVAIMKEEGKQSVESGALSEITPKKIKEYLDEWIIGQEEAKITLSIALYNHYKRINQDMDEDDKIEKSNVILVGHTGSGKTALVQALAKGVDLPLVIEDVTSISTTGYVGRDVTDILKKLIEAADGDVKKAQNGIVLLDEGDKLKREKASNGQRDVKGEGVQQGLLKIVEGGTFDVRTSYGMKEFDTSNVLFILSGAFENIEKTINKRLKSKEKNTTTGGFTGKLDNKKDDQRYNELIVQVKHEDLKQFGMMPELLGRFPVVTAVEDLSEEALTEILTKPKNAIVKQYKKLFAEDDVELEFSDEALLAIAKEAKSRKIGARALRSIVEEVLKKPMYEVPSEVEVETVLINGDLSAEYIRAEEQDDEDEEINNNI